MQTKLWHATRNLLAQLARENEYLRTENQVLKQRLKASGKRLNFTDEQRRELAVKAKAPETLMRWHRTLVAMKFDSSKVKRKPGRPRIEVNIEKIVLELAKENKFWGLSAYCWSYRKPRRIMQKIAITL